MSFKLLAVRYKLFKQALIREALAQRPDVRRVLDVGCGDGEKALRLSHLPLQLAGIDIAHARLARARRSGLDGVCGTAAKLPFRDRAFELIHVAHVLHHVLDYRQALAEIRRCLAPSGRVLVVETVSDHPLIRVARKLHPAWHGDQVHHSWRYAALTEMLVANGFEIEESARYNILFWLWETLPDHWWPLEILTPLFVYLDLLLAPWFNPYAAHCYLVLKARPEPSGVAA